MSDDTLSHFLETGEHDALRYGASYVGLKRAHDELMNGLVAEVKRRAKGRRSPRLPPGFEPTSFTRRKVEPMVRGLFPRREEEAVLSALERSVVFVTRRNFERLMRAAGLLSSARAVADLYLGMVGGEQLSENSPRLLGFSEETTCYVTARYFAEVDRFADIVVHEAAHVFHNCKRQMIGLPHTRHREWLLDIDFRKRETFAYSCEAYSRILEMAKSPAERRAIADEFAEEPWALHDERVDAGEVTRLVHEASRVRNGWKLILRGCAPARASRDRSGAALR